MCELTRPANNADNVLANLPPLNQNIEAYNSLIHLKDTMDFQIRSFVNRMKETKGFDLHGPKAKDTSPQCTYNGVLKREISAGGSHSYCECHEGYMGDNCELSPLVVTTTTHYVRRVLENLATEIRGEPHMTRRVFILKALILALQFKLSLEMVQKVTEIAQNFLLHHYKGRKTKDVFILVDLLLRSLVSNGEELKRKSRKLHDGDIVTDRARHFVFRGCIQAIHLLRKASEDYYASHVFSFLDIGKANYIETLSFTVNEFDLSSYLDKFGFSFQNPRFEHSFRSKENNLIRLNFRTKMDQSKDFVVLQAMTVSSFFFALQFEEQRLMCLSNLVGLRYFDPVFGRTTSGDMNKYIDKMTLELEVYVLPPDDDPKEGMMCAGYDFEGRLEPVYGFVQKFDEEKMHVVCDFGIFFPLDRFWFGVFAKK